jgi:glutamine amidotransferase
MKTVAILDYGLGNLRSVMRGLERSGARPTITADIEEASSADGIVLPGVGAFSQGMEQLGAIQDTLIAYVREAPVLGICLGMQMLMEWSEENGIHRGLGLVPGTVRRFPKAAGFKVPHMGWNTIHVGDECPLFYGIPQGSFVYFVHSYYADTAPEYRASTTSYIRPFASSLHNGNAFGVQFHPEKSGAVGLKILENFIGLL